MVHFFYYKNNNKNKEPYIYRYTKKLYTMNSIILITIGLSVALIGMGIYCRVLFNKVAILKDKILRLNTRVNVLTRSNKKLSEENYNYSGKIGELNQAIASISSTAEMYKDQYEGAMMVLDEYTKNLESVKNECEAYKHKAKELNQLYVDICEDNQYYKMLLTGDVDNWN